MYEVKYREAINSGAPLAGEPHEKAASLNKTKARAQTLALSLSLSRISSSAPPHPSTGRSRLPRPRRSWRRAPSSASSPAPPPPSRRWRAEKYVSRRPPRRHAKRRLLLLLFLLFLRSRSSLPLSHSPHPRSWPDLPSKDAAALSPAQGDALPYTHNPHISLAHKICIHDQAFLKFNMYIIAQVRIPQLQNRTTA